MRARVVSINISDRKGVRKTPVDDAVVRANFGVEGDAHSSADWHRQVSLLLMLRTIEKMKEVVL